ncbi:hypothetical protein [Kitasatospora sp. NPDC051914]|uniref:hypothetical protein n=1 Tax=Kitasatospora sp. NPDC051914 TaxID=3154945 RepID=UPI003418C2D2
MGFTGNLTVARSHTPLAESSAVRASGALPQQSAQAGAWQFLATSGEDVRAAALAAETAGPVVSAFVLEPKGPPVPKGRSEGAQRRNDDRRRRVQRARRRADKSDSDFAVVEAFDADGPTWTCVLSPETALDYDCPQDWIGEPAETARTAADWAAAHGLTADHAALAAVLAAESDPFAEDLVLELFAALGLPFGTPAAT